MRKGRRTCTSSTINRNLSEHLCPKFDFMLDKTWGLRIPDLLNSRDSQRTKPAVSTHSEAPSKTTGHPIKTSCLQICLDKFSRSPEVKRILSSPCCRARTLHCEKDLVEMQAKIRGTGRWVLHATRFQAERTGIVGICEILGIHPLSISQRSKHPRSSCLSSSSCLTNMGRTQSSSHTA